MSKSINIGHELRLVLCVALLIVVNWVAPRRNEEGEIISNGLGLILKRLKIVHKLQRSA